MDYARADCVGLGVSDLHPRAFRAASVYVDFMVVHFKPRGHKASKIGRTSVKIKDTSTGFAAKVMVMVLSRKLIPLGLARNFDGDQPALFHEAFHGTIDRGNSEIWGMHPAILKDLLRAQGTLNLAKNPANGASL